jgi:hypothetical protein
LGYFSSYFFTLRKFFKGGGLLRVGRFDKRGGGPINKGGNGINGRGTGGGESYCSMEVNV